MSRRSPFRSTTAATALLAAMAVGCSACAPADDLGIEDGEDDAFTGGKADGATYSDAELRRVLKLANDPSLDVARLRAEVGLGPSAARNIVKRRDGRDALPGTADDRPFATIAELDQVKLVGDAVIAALSRRAEAERLSVGERVIDVGGRKLVVHVAGEGPIALVHPGGPGMDWDYLRMPLVEDFLTLVYVEPAGTGASDRLDGPADYTLARSVEDLEAVRAALGRERVYVLGHSAGGFVAQAYALAHPEHVAALILYDTSPTTGDDWAAELEANMAWFAEEPWYPAALEALDAQAEVDPAEDPAEYERLDKLVQGFYFFDYTGRAAEIDAFLAPIGTNFDALFGPEDAEVFDVRPRLGEIAARTLIIVGERDYLCGKRWARALARGIAGSRQVTLAASGHYGHFEEPAAFAAALATFAGAPPPAAP